MCSARLLLRSYALLSASRRRSVFASLRRRLTVDLRRLTGRNTRIRPTARFCGSRQRSCPDDDGALTLALSRGAGEGTCGAPKGDCEFVAFHRPCGLEPVAVLVASEYDVSLHPRTSSRAPSPMPLLCGVALTGLVLWDRRRLDIPARRG